MLPQWVILLGARTRVGTKARRRGSFESRDYVTMEDIVRKEHGFLGCTIVRGKGFYEGRGEDTVQIIILDSNYEKVKECAQKLRQVFRQESVLVVGGGVGEFLT